MRTTSWRERSRPPARRARYGGADPGGHELAKWRRRCFQSGPAPGHQDGGERDQQIIDVLSLDTYWNGGTPRLGGVAVTARVPAIHRRPSRRDPGVAGVARSSRQHAHRSAGAQSAGQRHQVTAIGMTDRLWQAYATLDSSRVYSAGAKRLTTDLVALVHYAVSPSATHAGLGRFALQSKRFDAWLDGQYRRRGESFTSDQLAYRR